VSDSTAGATGKLITRLSSSGKRTQQHSTENRRDSINLHRLLPFSERINGRLIEVSDLPAEIVTCGGVRNAPGGGLPMDRVAAEREYLVNLRKISTVGLTATPPTHPNPHKKAQCTTAETSARETR
jgi:hypothetical protein